MTPKQFRHIRTKVLNLTHQKMAAHLGLKSDRIIRYYESGAQPIPEWVVRILDLEGLTRGD